MAWVLLFQVWDEMDLLADLVAEFWRLPEHEQDEFLDKLLLMVAEILDRRASPYACRAVCERCDGPARGQGLN